MFNNNDWKPVTIRGTDFGSMSLLDKYSWINLKASKLNPYAFSFAIRSSRSKQLKALDRLVNNALRFYLGRSFFSFFEHC